MAGSYKEYPSQAEKIAEERVNNPDCNGESLHYAGPYRPDEAWEDLLPSPSSLSIVRDQNPTRIVTSGRTIFSESEEKKRIDAAYLEEQDPTVVECRLAAKEKPVAESRAA